MADRSCMVLINSGVLMLRQTYRGQSLWTFPGGGIKPGETPESAAIREVKEEVCIDAEIAEKLCQIPRRSGPGTYHCYLGRIVAGQATLGNDPELSVDAQEIHELHWFLLDEVRDHPEVERVWTNLTKYR